MKTALFLGTRLTHRTLPLGSFGDISHGASGPRAPRNLHWQLSPLRSIAPLFFFLLAITAHFEKAKKPLNPASLPDPPPLGTALSNSRQKGNLLFFFTRMTPFVLGLNYSLMTST